MNKFNYKNLTPFKWFVLENFPFIEADFDALTNWQLFCKIGKELNKIINSENILGTQMENVTNAFIDLKNYIDNYFNNLNVQEEINNKLDKMVEDGTLENIINQQIFGEINEKIDNLNKDVVICIGDSWTANTNNTSIWKNLIGDAYNYNIKNYAVSGSGFITGGNDSFYNQAQRAVEDTSYKKEKVKFIIVIGGVNDVKYSSATFDNMINPVQTLFNYLQNNFKCQIIFIPNYEYPFNRQLVLWSNIKKLINYTSLVKICDIIPLQNFAHFEDNMFHLTQDGQRFMAGNIVKCMFGGKLCNFIYHDSFNIEDKLYCNIVQTIEDDVVHVSLYGYFKNTPNTEIVAYNLPNNLPCKFIDSHTLYANIADNIENQTQPYIEVKLENNNALTFAYKGNNSHETKYDFHIDFEYDVSNIQL